MIPRWTCLLLALIPALLCHAGPPCLAGEGGEPAPTLKHLESLLAQRSPAVASMGAAVRAASSDVAPAGALPDPVVEIFLQDVGFPDITVGSEEMSNAGGEVRQDLLFPGKRKARRNAALAEVALRTSERLRLERKLLTELRVLYARLYQADRERQALAAAGELLEMLEATAAARTGAGQASQRDLIKVQLEISRLRERTEDVETRRKTLVAEIRGLLDFPEGLDLGEVPSLPPVPLPPDDLEERALAHAPDIAVQQEVLRTAERRLQAARTELRPNLSAGAGAAYRGDMDPITVFRLEAELPLWSGWKQKPAIAARAFEVETARFGLQEVRARVRTELEQLLARRASLIRQKERYREAILPQTSASLGAARASYLSGQGEFSAVVQDWAAWLENQVELARREAEEFMVWAGLAYLAGPSWEEEGRAGSHVP